VFSSLEEFESEPCTPETEVAFKIADALIIHMDVNPFDALKKGYEVASQWSERDLEPECSYAIEGMRMKLNASLGIDLQNLEGDGWEVRRRLIELLEEIPNEMLPPAIRSLVVNLREIVDYHHSEEFEELSPEIEQFLNELLKKDSS